MIMSPFIIFAIVLTISYVLYYATIITMDLNAKSKKEGEHEETISASDTKDAEEYAPQTVLEDTKTGGFSFLESTENNENSIEEVIESINTPTIADDDPHLDIAEISANTDGDNRQGTEDVEPSEEHQDNVDDKSSINTISAFSKVPPEEKEDEVFDESKAFNQDMAQPQYAVSSIIGNEKDAALTQRIEEINQRLMDCPTERGLRNPIQLASEMRENREHSNIDLKDEYTQC